MHDHNNSHMLRNDESKPNTVAIFFVSFLVLSVLLCVFLAIDFFGRDKHAAVEYVIGSGDGVVTYKLSGNEAYSSNGILMVCFDEIAELCEMTITGSVNERVFYARNSNQRIKILNGSNTVVVNNRTLEMRVPAELRTNGMFIPIDFIEENMDGIKLDFDKNKLTVLRGEYNSSTKDNPEFMDIAFAGSDDNPIGTPDLEGKNAPKYKFVADLSTFEEYMCPEDTDAYLVLVNRDNTVNKSYVPSNLVPITNVRKDGRSETMVETAEKALQALYIEMRAMGYTDVSVTSGYRSYDKQEYLYGIYTENEMRDHPDWSRARAEQEVDTYSSRAGTSEHQTGLCVDMHNLGSASQRFAEEDAYDWLVENCYKFGFILRFPKGKEEITGYSFEPWHYRFVGRYHASEMHRLDMCLEEYLEYLNAE